MHCSNCGTYIAPGARFCSGCGKPAADPEETRIASRPAVALEDTDEDSDRIIFSVRPTTMFVKMGYGAAALAAIAFVVLLAWLSVSALIAIPISLLLLLIPAYYHIKNFLVNYTLTASKLEISEGLMSRTTRNLPLSKIQDVTVSATIVQRLLGYGDVIVDNASEVGGTVILRNIRHPREHADMLLRELRRWG